MVQLHGRYLSPLNQGTVEEEAEKDKEEKRPENDPPHGLADRHISGETTSHGNVGIVGIVAV